MYKRLILTMALVLTSFNATAKNDCGTKEGDSLNVNCWDCGSNCTARLDTNGTMSISGTGTMKDFAYNNIPWKDQINNITTAYIDDNITSVGDRAFSGATQLKEVHIPTTATTIGYAAFSDAKALTSVDIPTSVTSIKGYAFSSSGLTNLNIPENVSSIDTYAFKETANLQEVLFSGNSQIKNLGTGTFENSGVKNITLPNSLTTIGTNAFRNSGLQNLDIPDSVTSIASGAFAHAANLTTVNFSGNSNLETIGVEAFGSSGLTLFTLPPSVITIEKNAFSNTNQLTEFNISESSNLESIGYAAFSGCALQNIDLPDGLTAIDSMAFYAAKFTGIIEIPDSVTSIGDYAFGVNNSIQGVVFSEKSELESLAGGAFYDATALKTLILPPNFQFAPETTLNLRYTGQLNTIYLTAEQMKNLTITGKENSTNFAPTIYQMNSDGTVSVMGDVEGFLGVEKQNLPKVAYASFADLVSGTISEQYTYKDNKKRVWDANGNYKYYCRYQVDFSSACFTKKGKFLGRYDPQGNRIYKKIYTVEEAMEATKDGDRFNVLLRYQ